MPGFPWSFWSMFRRGARARRGDVRAAILSLLSEQPRNGYQIMRELAERSQGAWRPSPGSVYPQLQQLEDEGLVRQEASGVAPGGRVFALTDAGRTYVDKHRDELAAAWENTAPGEGDGYDLRRDDPAAPHRQRGDAAGAVGQRRADRRGAEDPRRRAPRALQPARRRRRPHETTTTLPTRVDE